MKKLMIIATFLFISPLQGEELDCKELLRDAGKNCQSRIESHCDFLKNCLVRRDTCVPDGVPETMGQCYTVSRCMKKYSAKMDDGPCTYIWSEDRGTKCHVDSKPFRSEQHCPGRILGFLNAIGYGFSASIDSGFNCSGHNNKVLVDIKDCKKKIARIKKECNSKEDKAELKKIKISSCKESEQFNPKAGNKYSLDGTRGQTGKKEVNESSRKAEQEIVPYPINKNRSPVKPKE